MTFLGVGTKFYGKTKYNPEDKSYITTKWFSLNLIPFFPIKSYRVIKKPKQKGKSFRFKIMADDDFGFGIKDNLMRFKIIEEIPLKKSARQFLLTYLFYYGLIGLGILSYFLLTPLFVVLVFVVPIAFLLNSKNEGFF